MSPNKLKNLKIMYGVLKRLGYSPSKLRPVLNKTRPEEARAWIERVQIDVARILPPASSATRAAIQEGVPVTAARPDGDLARGIREFLAPILKLPSETPKKDERGLLARLLG
jgi:MinD-like ATPase involved in chromosome partitioning or flagellar assembly